MSLKNRDEFAFLKFWLQCPKVSVLYGLWLNTSYTLNTSVLPHL